MGCNCSGAYSFDEGVPDYFFEECNCIFQSIEKLPDIEKADCNHAYILPNNDVYVLNYEENKLVKLNGMDTSKFAKKPEDVSILDEKLKKAIEAIAK